MIKNKKLKTLVKKSFKNCFEKDKISELKLSQLLSDFKKLPSHEAIVSTALLLDEVKKYNVKTTLTVESATPISSLELKKIEKKLASSFTIQTSEFILNPSLLGGIKVKVGDVLFDNSVIGKLNQIKEVIAHG